MQVYRPGCGIRRATGGIGMMEDEELFVRLSMMPARDHADARELILQGYLDHDFCDTDKSCRFQRSFIDAKKGPVFAAIQAKGSSADLEAIMEQSGIKYGLTFERVANTLVAVRLLTRENKMYLPAAGEGPR